MCGARICFDLTYFFGHLLKHGLNTDAFLRRDLGPDHFVFVGEAFRPRLVNFVHLNRQVDLVACERHDESVLVCCSILFHLADPVLDRLVRLLAGQVVANDCADCIAVVHIDHRPEPLVTTRVPDVHLDLLFGPLASVGFCMLMTFCR